MNQSTKTSSRYNGVIGPDMNNVINVSGWTKRLFLIFFTHFIFHFHTWLSFTYQQVFSYYASLHKSQFETRLLHVLLHITSQGINSALPIVYI